MHTDQRIDIPGLIRAVDEVVGDVARPVPLHVPSFQGNEWKYVKECVDTGWVSSAGSFVDRFEKELATFCGASHAVVVVNGTSALHMALMLLGVGGDDEVLVPSLTFVATANAVAYCGAQPHFVDCDRATLGVDPGKLDEYLSQVAEVRDGVCFHSRTGRRIAALVVMHTFGHPADLDALAAVSDRWHLPWIEDAAESLGSYYRGRHTGTIGRLGIFSFNGNKTITTGGGGAIVTEDAELAQRAKHLTSTGKSPHRWEYHHDQLAWNYRMPNINAALGCAQLESMPKLLDAKRKIAESYVDAFQQLEGASIFVEPSFARSNYWLNVMLLDQADLELRDQVLESMHAAGLLVRPAWIPLHRLPMYEDCPRMDLSTTHSLYDRIINLPSTAELCGESSE